MDERYEIRDPVLGTVACFLLSQSHDRRRLLGLHGRHHLSFHLSRAQYAPCDRMHRDGDSDRHVFSVGVYPERLSAGRRRLVDDDHRAHCGADGGLSAA